MKGGKFHRLISQSFRGIQPKIDPNAQKTSYIISIKDLYSGKVNFSDLRKDTFCIPEGRSEQMLREGDLIISLRGTSFKAAVFEVPKFHPEFLKLLTGCYLDENLAGFRLSFANAKIIAAYLNSDDGQNYLESIASGTRVKSLSIKNIENMILPQPAFEIQKELERFLVLSDALIEKMDEEKASVIEIRNAAIKKYMEVS